MIQYIETTNESKMIALQEIMNAHLDGITCKTVIDTKKHLTEDKWFFNKDLFEKTMGNSKYFQERRQQIGEFVSDNDDVYFKEYTNEIEAGYQEVEVE